MLAQAVLERYGRPRRRAGAGGDAPALTHQLHPPCSYWDFQSGVGATAWRQQITSGASGGRFRPHGRRGHGWHTRTARARWHRRCLRPTAGRGRSRPVPTPDQTWRDQRVPDTSALLDAIRRPERSQALLRSLQSEQFWWSSVVLAELYAGTRLPEDRVILDRIATAVRSRGRLLTPNDDDWLRAGQASHDRSVCMARCGHVIIWQTC